MLTSVTKQYFHQYEWFFAVLHKETFLCEVDRFWQMYPARRYEVDPAWLAVLFSVRGLSSDACHSQK